jgi:hypothetical protein
MNIVKHIAFHAFAAIVGTGLGLWVLALIWFGTPDLVRWMF